MLLCPFRQSSGALTERSYFDSNPDRKSKTQRKTRRFKDLLNDYQSVKCQAMKDIEDAKRRQLQQRPEKRHPNTSGTPKLPPLDRANTQVEEPAGDTSPKVVDTNDGESPSPSQTENPRAPSVSVRVGNRLVRRRRKGHGAHDEDDIMDAEPIENVRVFPFMLFV